jgi:hypothetical protein
MSIASILLATLLAAAPAELVVNGDFEQGQAGWGGAWSRDRGAIDAKLDASAPHGGKQAMTIVHTGQGDWSLQQQKWLPVEPGEIYELRAWVRVAGEGNATLCVTLRDGKEGVIDWSYGDASTRTTDGWHELTSRFIIPATGKQMLPRVIGHSPATVALDDVSLRRVGSIDDKRAKDMPERLVVRSKTLELTLNTADGALAVQDLRTKRAWRQRVETPVVLLSATAGPQQIDARLLDPASMLEFNAAFRLSADAAEIDVTLSAEGALPRSLKYPHPFVSDKGSFLVMPVNEGISYPVDDASLPAMHYILYGGHGLCMAWYGVVERHVPGASAAGLMTLVDTPDDAAVRVERRDDLLCCVPLWEPQKGQFGPPRKLRYVLLDDGGYVAMCKRYRRHAAETSLLKTFTEKRKRRPDIDLLVGAVNIWCWDRDAVGICKELQQAGIDRILWSNRASPEAIDAMNQLGVLTSRYDIYQDVMDPANFPDLRHVHGDWTTAAWPNDLMIDAKGDWIRGWAVKAKDDTWRHCGVTCDARAVEYARQRITEERKTHHYRSRFIDTTTASPWRECYHADHPLTRSESRQWKMRLLDYISNDCGLVCGCETGHDAAVPFCDYFEGMLSLGPYRVPDSGRNMQQMLDEVPERVARFQTGHGYRLPLWELVYHDCVVAQWYWGDYNNKLPSLWTRRDLWNALYGTPPMLMFTRKFWQENRERFVESYRASAPIARATGYHEMLSHAWLTADRSVQQTRFANGLTVTANFGDSAFTLPDGTRLPPLGKHVTGLTTVEPPRNASQ